ncbi:MAG: hypothetical protein NEHIOOID_00044 [Holosporales bacterium]
MISIHDYAQKKYFRDSNHIIKTDNPASLQIEESSTSLAEDFSKDSVVLAKEKESLKSLLQRKNIAEEDILKIVKSVKAEVGSAVFTKDQPVIMDVQENTVQRISFRLLNQYDVVTTYQDGKYQTQKKEIQLSKKLKFVSGTIDGNFHKAAKRSGLPAKLVKTAAVNLGYLINFQHELKKGDTYQFVYESYQDDKNKDVKSGHILYIKMTTKNKEYILYGYPKADGKHLDYYTKTGEGVVRGLLQTPLDGRRVRITSGFTLKGRHHPILGFCRAHKGVDFGATYGTPVIAAGDGVITQAGYDGDYGNKITISHQGGYKTVYAHLSKIRVKRGEFVKQRQVIGAVGSTGLSSGPHLHFETIVNNVHVNPMGVKQLPAVKLSGSELKKFQNHTLWVDKKVKDLDPPTVVVESNAKQT